MVAMPAPVSPMPAPVPAFVLSPIMGVGAVAGGLAIARTASVHGPVLELLFVHRTKRTSGGGGS